MSDSKMTPKWNRTEKANQDIDYFLAAYSLIFTESDKLRLERIRAALPRGNYDVGF